MWKTLTNPQLGSLETPTDLPASDLHLVLHLLCHGMVPMQDMICLPAEYGKTILQDLQRTLTTQTCPVWRSVHPLLFCPRPPRMPARDSFCPRLFRQSMIEIEVQIKPRKVAFGPTSTVETDHGAASTVSAHNHRCTSSPESTKVFRHRCQWRRHLNNTHLHIYK